MPRVRWCPLSVFCLCFGVFFTLGIDKIAADCWYEDEKFDEGSLVVTAEPCLNCTCNRGTLLCYLRVCPRLPDPPPPGCILLHRYRTCCPELICEELSSQGGNSLEARSEPDGLDLPYDPSTISNACIANGSIYAPGSAMDSSSMCEYCYCLGGKQVCVKPKCLVPIEGCTPTYDHNDCCPVHYNCTNALSITTTTEKPALKEDSCLVDGKEIVEGGKVLGLGHSICDNCYCIRGIVRCEPQSCAPPLLGCTPIIKSGECCAASYNCSGTIETQPEPYYGQYPIVSKEYAKLRKEVQKKPIKLSTSTNNSVTEDLPFYVLAESPTATTKTTSNQRATFGTTRHFVGKFNPSTTLFSPTIKPINERHNYYGESKLKIQKSKPAKSTSTTERSLVDEEILRSGELNLSEETIFSLVDSLLDGRFNRRVENETSTTSTTAVPTTETTITSTNSTFNSSSITNHITNTTNSTISTTVPIISTTTETVHSTSDAITTEVAYTTTYDSVPSTLRSLEDNLADNTVYSEDSSTTTMATTIEEETTDSGTISTEPTTVQQLITMRTVLNSTDCTVDVTTVLPVDANEINKLAELKEIEDYLSTTTNDYNEDNSTETEFESTTFNGTNSSSKDNDITEVDLESRVKVGSVDLAAKIPPEIEAILNITKEKNSNDYEYDYNEPTLPPSLPNLKIIPFVAADALDTKTDVIKDKVDDYPEERIQNANFDYGNLFSPPEKTEGGFVPKEPPLLDSFYENQVTVATMSTPASTNVNCISNGKEVLHGEPVPSDSACSTCSCFYGNIVCQKTPCPIPAPNCRKSSVQDLTLCCPHYICDDKEVPSLLLDTISKPVPEIVTVADGIVTPDPFRNVIKTEPAPNLQSLIVDMMPYLSKQTTTTTAIPPTSSTTSTTSTEDDFSLDKVLQLLFSSDKETTTNPTTTFSTTTIGSTSTTESVKPDNLNKFMEKEEEEKKNHFNKTNTNNNNRLSNNAIESNKSKPEKSDQGAVGLLKLAGCNIYGRMYRVGRIISELSGPCLECKCTEIGVQCKNLKC